MSDFDATSTIRICGYQFGANSRTVCGFSSSPLSPVLISPPFLPTPSTNSNALDPMMDAVDAFTTNTGIYPIALDRRWHCGLHLIPQYQTSEIRAIADGEVVAYRVTQKAISDGQKDDVSGAESLNSNQGFVLLKHMTETGDGRSITFYSLYMHLLDLNNITGLMGNVPPVGSSPHVMPEWLRMPTDGAVSGAGKKVYRKDVLGYPGKCNGRLHLHIEIFMLPSDFEDYFGTTQLGNTQLSTPTGNDYWGHSYYVIPPGQAFLRQPPGTNAQNKLNDIVFAPLQSGQNEDTLHVETYFHKGDKYTHAWAVDTEGTRTQLTADEPAPEKDYEYDLYKRATKLYPACPSDGYELLRFGRILSSPTTLPAGPSRATWMRMTFATGQEGYLDINNDAVAKLSDADFPVFKRWQKITEGNTPFSDDGLCDIDVLKRMLGDANMPPEPDDVDAFWQKMNVRSDAMNRYLSSPSNEHVREQLRGFVCEAPTEWDADKLEQRYEGLRKEGEVFYGKDAAYREFIAFAGKFCFWDKTGLPSGKLWFFHPLQFIRFFRRCGWLSQRELSQCIPRKNLHLRHTNFQMQQVSSWSTASQRSTKWHQALNKMMRKYCISSSPLRIAHFLSQSIEESGYLRLVKEGNGEHAGYAPYYGRGLIQITHLGNYKKYGEFRKFQINHPSDDPKFSALNWNPDVLLAVDDANFNADNCADSAGFYWTCPDITSTGENGLKISDSGENIQTMVRVSKLVNGNVAMENINGLDIRLQLFIFYRCVLLDFIPEDMTERISFTWRRNSNREPILTLQGQPVLDAHGNPKKKYYPANHTINIPLTPQRP